MGDFAISNLRKSFIRRYLLGLFIVAMLAIFAFGGLIWALNGSDNSAYLVNVSGKQRMLSQTIALDAFRMYELKQPHHALLSGGASQPLAFVKNRMRKNIDEMAFANQQLSSAQLPGQPPGQLNTSLDAGLSNALTSLYFGEPNLANEVESYLALATHLLEQQSPENSLEQLTTLSDRSVALLVKLDKAVKVYQQEGEQKLFYIKVLESFVLFFTMVALLFEAVFIFQPMVRRVTEFAGKLQDTTRELEYKVELRTLKLAEANKKLTELAYHDALTGLQNRLNLEKDLERIIDKHSKYNVPFAVLMMDIDWFKTVNDEYGHDAGDFVLKEISALLLKHLRLQDLVYRAGGEEFVLLFESLSLDDAMHKAEQIRHEIEHYHFEYQGVKIRRTVSFGAYHSDLQAFSNVKSILKVVDEALYQSKVIGRNRVTLSQKNPHVDRHDAISQEKYKVRFYFNEISFAQVEVKREFGDQDECLKPYRVSNNVFELLCVQPEILIEGKRCIREFMHSNDFDSVKRFSEFGKKLPELSAQYHQRTLLWETTFRILNQNGSVKISSADTYFCPAAESGSLGSLELEMCESQHAHVVFGDSLLVYNLHAMLENTNDVIYFKDRFHVFTAASKTLVKYTNVKHRAELIGKTDYDVFPKEYADQYFKLEKQVFSGDVSVAQEYQTTLDDQGNKGWVDNRKYPIKDQTGKVIGLFGIARVITDAEHEAQLNLDLNS